MEELETKVGMLENEVASANRKIEALEQRLDITEQTMKDLLAVLSGRTL